MISVSVGPASRSMPTRPNSCRWADGLRSQRQGGNRLHAAEDIDLVGAAERHGGDRRSRRRPIERRRAGDDPFYAGDPRRHDAHVGGRNHRIATTRHVAADALNRHVAVPETYARQGFDLDVMDTRALGFRKAPNLSLSEFDVFDDPRRQARDQCIDFSPSETEARRFPAVEAHRELAHRVIAAMPNLGDDRFDGLADFTIGFRDLLLGRTLLEVADHACSPFAVAHWSRLHFIRRSSPHPASAPSQSSVPMHRKRERRPHP